MLNSTNDPPGNEHAPMWEKVYFHVHRKLAAGELRGGNTVSELSLAKELGISRTPVREALSRLSAEGIIEQTRNRRLVVVTLTRQDIIDLYELREALESYVVGKVAHQTLRKADLEKLQSLTDSILKLKEEISETKKPELEKEQMRRLVANDMGFHTLLLRTAGNSRIIKIVNETRLLIQIFSMRRAGHDEALLDQIHRYHCDIIRAVVEKDPERSKRLISEHIQRSLQERLDDYDRWEIEGALRRSFPYSFDIYGLNG